MFDLSGDYVLLDLICLVSFSTKTINGFPDIIVLSFIQTNYEGRLFVNL